MHRYSILQQHAEANGVDGVDTLDTGSHNNKSGYHDDSDEVRPSLTYLTNGVMGEMGQGGDRMATKTPNVAHALLFNTVV